MKKLLFALFTLTIFTIGCSRQIEINPAVLSEGEINVTLDLELLLIYDNHNDLNLLESLDLKKPSIPNREFEFVLELVEFEVNEESLELYEASLTFDEIIIVNDDLIVELPNLTFYGPGRYTFVLKQVVTEIFPDKVEDKEYEWALDHTFFSFVVTVFEDVEKEELVAVVDGENYFVFKNKVTFDWTDRVEDALTESQQVNDVNVTESSTNSLQSGQGHWGNNSGIPENYATTLTNDQGMSYLALVNRHFRLPSGFSPNDLSAVNVASTGGTHQLRYSAARSVESLFAAAAAEGFNLVATSGYRSYSVQASTHQHWINVLGATEARRVSARAGHSEHQLGLALDVTTGTLGVLSQSFSSTPEGIWLRNNAHRFGFIIRYPANRELDTGYIYEPWHIRFVGIASATTIFQGNLILEDYLR